MALRVTRRAVAPLALAGALLVPLMAAPVAEARGNSCRDGNSTLRAIDEGSGFQIHAVGGFGLVAYVPNETQAELRHNYRFRPDTVVKTGVATRRYDERIFSGLENVFEASIWVDKASLGLREAGDYADIHVKFGESALRQFDTCDMRVWY